MFAFAQSDDLDLLPTPCVSSNVMDLGNTAMSAIKIENNKESFSAIRFSSVVALENMKYKIVEQRPT